MWKQQQQPQDKHHLIDDDDNEEENDNNNDEDGDIDEEDFQTPPSEPDPHFYDPRGEERSRQGTMMTITSEPDTMKTGSFSQHSCNDSTSPSPLDYNIGNEPPTFKMEAETMVTPDTTETRGFNQQHSNNAIGNNSRSSRNVIVHEPEPTFKMETDNNDRGRTTEDLIDVLRALERDADILSASPAKIFNTLDINTNEVRSRNKQQSQSQSSSDKCSNSNFNHIGARGSSEINCDGSFNYNYNDLGGKDVLKEGNGNKCSGEVATNNCISSECESISNDIMKPDPIIENLKKIYQRLSLEDADNDTNNNMASQQLTKKQVEKQAKLLIDRNYENINNANVYNDVTDKDRNVMRKAIPFSDQQDEHVVFPKVSDWLDRNCTEDETNNSFGNEDNGYYVTPELDSDWMKVNQRTSDSNNFDNQIVISQEEEEEEQHVYENVNSSANQKVNNLSAQTTNQQHVAIHPVISTSTNNNGHSNVNNPSAIHIEDSLSEHEVQVLPNQTSIRPYNYNSRSQESHGKSRVLPHTNRIVSINSYDGITNPGEYSHNIIEQKQQEESNNTIPKTRYSDHEIRQTSDTATTETDKIISTGVKFSSETKKQNKFCCIPVSMETKTRLVLLFCAMLYKGSTPNALIAQYLLDFWADDDSGNNNGSTITTVTDHHNVLGGVESNKCFKNESASTSSHTDHVQERVSREMLLFSLTTGIPALITCLVFGAVIDLWGRRHAFRVSILGGCLKYAVTVAIIHFHLHPTMFYVAFFMDGLCGGYFVNYMASYSIMTDTSSHKEGKVWWVIVYDCLRTIIDAGYSVGVGLLIKYIGYQIAAIFILAPTVLSLIVAVLFLPETLILKPSEQSEFESEHQTHQNQKKKKKSVTLLNLKKLVISISRIFFLYTRDGEKSVRASLFCSLMIFFTAVLTFMGQLNIDTLFQRHAPLCWNSAMIGYYYAEYRLTFSLMGMTFFSLARRIGCLSSEKLALVGSVFLGAGCLMEGFVTETWQMFLVPVLVIPAFCITPITRGVMAHLAGPGKRGVMFSSVALIEVGCSMGAVTVFNNVYSVTVATHPGFVYFILAAFAAITALIYIPFFRHYDPSRPSLSSHDTSLLIQADA